MKGAEPWHQTNWDWRAAGNFIGGGSGAGLLILAAIAASGDTAFWPPGVAALALIGVGLVCVWLEIGRPWRALHVFFHPQTSWMTRESIVSMPLFAVGLIALALTFWAERVPAVAALAIWLGAALAAAYLFCQAQILFASKGIPAWRWSVSLPSGWWRPLWSSASLGAGSVSTTSNGWLPAGRRAGRSRRGYFEKRLATARRRPQAHIQFGAVRGDRLIGLVLARVLTGEYGQEAPSVVLEVIDVDPEATGAGVGRALLAALEAEMRERRIAELQTEARWTAHDLLQFFAANGFSLAPRLVLQCPVMRADAL